VVILIGGETHHDVGLENPIHALLSYMCNFDFDVVGGAVQLLDFKSTNVTLGELVGKIKSDDSVGRR